MIDVTLVLIQRYQYTYCTVCVTILYADCFMALHVHKKFSLITSMHYSACDNHAKALD